MDVLRAVLYALTVGVFFAVCGLALAQAVPDGLLGLSLVGTALVGFVVFVSTQ